MSARLLAKELDAVGLRPIQTGVCTWRAVCPVCWTPDDPGRKSLGLWEWGDGTECIACWNTDCTANNDVGLTEAPYPGVTGIITAALWIAIIDRIGLDGLARAWGRRHAEQIAAQTSQAPRVYVPRITVPK